MISARKQPLLATFLLAVCVPGIACAQNVVLSVDRDTNIVSFSNTAATVGQVGLYEITSERGALDVSGWNPLSNSDASWRVVGAPSSSKLTEIKETGHISVQQGSPISLATAFDPASAKLNAGFGVDVEDLEVKFYDPVLDQLTTPAVVYTGEKIYNSLIVNIDTQSGLASIENESPFEVNLTGYTVRSALGELNPAWAGIRASDSANWGSAGISSTQVVSELNQNPSTAALTLPAGSSASLGVLYTGDGSNQDVSFDFILQGAETPLSSSVKYSSLGFSGDADVDQDIDGGDFLLLQRIAPQFIPTWEANYGTTPAAVSALTNAVPEPSSTLLVVLVVSSLLLTRGNVIRRAAP